MSQTPPTQGFGHSSRRLTLEFLLIGGGILVVGVLALWLISVFAESIAEDLPLSVDVAMGEAAFESLAPPSQRCTDPGPVRYVEELAKPLLEAANSPFTFQFTVVDDPAVNAFALPGGFVAVNMGLLEKATSGEEIAAVLGHELAHVTERHGTKRVARQVGSMVLLSLILGGTDFETLGLTAAGLASTAYDRDQEAAADTVSQNLLRSAGISPSGMADFFERLSKDSPDVPTFLSTHPDPGDRATSARTAASSFQATRSLPKPEGLRCR